MPEPTKEQFAEGLRTLAARIEAGDFADYYYESAVESVQYSLPESAWSRHAPGAERYLVCLRSNHKPKLPDGASPEGVNTPAISIPEWMLPARVAQS